MKYVALFNPLSSNGATDAFEQLLATLANDEVVKVDITTVNYPEFFASLQPDQAVLLCGGDGTLNRFVNDTAGIEINNDVYYYATGTGNDFWTDIGKQKGDAPVLLNPYLKDLPTVTVNGKTSYFINGVGYGIDGYCCEMGDKQRAEKPGTAVNYTAIAIKGLLFGYKRPNATITVDGVTKEYKGVWLAPSMNGRFYGGGMMAAPDQDRLNEERTVSLVVWHKGGKIKTLMAFPSIFKGEHVAHTDMIEVVKGHEIHVSFTRPTALQIDGETIKNVTEYTVKTAK